MSVRAACPCERRERLDDEAWRPDTCAIIAAGGAGERFGDARGKQFVELCGLPIASWSIIAFDRAPSVGHIVIVCARGRMDEMREDVLARLALSTPVSLAASGATRQDSVRCGLDAMPDGYPIVAIHDAARPLVEVSSIEASIACVRADPTLAGAICAARVTDTLKLAEDGIVVSTPDRSFFWAAQTPQTFRTQAVASAHRAARDEGYVGTDDASLVERQGGRVRCVETPRDNIKITMPEDLAVAEATLRQRLVDEGCGRGASC